MEIVVFYPNVVALTKTVNIVLRTDRREVLLVDRYRSALLFTQLVTHTTDGVHIAQTAVQREEPGL